MMKIAVLTVSDSCSAGERKDISGPTLSSLICSSPKVECSQVEVGMVPDVEERIAEKMIDLCSRNDVVISTGGTGFGKRDVTPEATIRVVSKRCSGLEVAIHSHSLQKTPMAALSRAVAGIRNSSLIVNFPGSPKAVKMRLIFLRLLTFLVALTICVDGQLVKTSLGQIQGFEYETLTGDVAEIFLNIPYAKPPIGELRFEKPVPIEPWSHTINATAFGYNCVTHVAEAAVDVTSEDCLTLNIIKPKKQPPPEGFPVLFWVHGGAFELGAASIYGYKGFAEAYTKKDIIIVTVQYRLAFLGFLSTGDDELKGNNGLWDQRLSLKFVHDHISTFGGNPSKITVWGLSAGGAAVGQLAISPHTRDYVFSSIEMSGSPWVNWAVGPRVVKHSLELIKDLGCENDVKKCMKTKTIDEIQAAVNRVGRTTMGANLVKWGPRIDGDFFPDIPHNLVMNAKRHIPCVLGVSEKDAGFFTVMNNTPTIHYLYPGKENLDTFNRNSLEAYIRRILSHGEYGDSLEKAVAKAMEFYADRGYQGEGDHFFLNRYTEFVTDIMFNVAVVREAMSKRDAGWPVYTYSFDHYNEEIWRKYGVHDHVKGSVHVNEFSYMLDIFALGKFEMKGAEAVVRDAMQNFIVSMAHTGKPSLPQLEFEPVGKNEKLRYLSIRGEPEMRDGFYYGPFKFWEGMRKFGYDMINMNKTTVEKDEL